MRTKAAGVTSNPAEDPGQRSPTAVRRIVAGWAWLTVAVIAGVLALDLQAGLPPLVDPWLVLGLAMLIAVAGALHFVVTTVPGQASEVTTLLEVGLVPTVVLLRPTVAIPVALVAAAVAQLIVIRRQVAKLVFNLSWQLLGVAIGGWMFWQLSPTGFDADARSIAGGCLVAGVIVATNLIALSTIHAALSGRRVWDLLTDHLAPSVFVDLVMAVTGVLVATLYVLAPAALPLLLAPLFLYRGRGRARSEGFRQLEVERDRFERTVAGARDGVVLLDAERRVQIWNPAMERLTGLPMASVIGRRPEEVGLAGLVPGLGGERRFETARTEVDVRRSELASGDGSVLVVLDVGRDRELARIREDLVSRVSHELRTPLTTTAGFLETLEARWDELSDDHRRDLVASARRGSTRLGRLLDTLLLWSGIEARTKTGTAVDGPRTDIRDVLSRQLPADVRLHPDDLPGDGPLFAAIGEHDLQIILDQLIENARHYGQPPIEVRLRHDASAITLAVTDRGPGLPAGTGDELLEPFRQGDEGLRRTAQGLGLGLAIVQRVAAGAGGRVVLDREQDAVIGLLITLPRAGGVVPEITAQPAEDRKATDPTAHDA